MSPDSPRLAVPYTTIECRDVKSAQRELASLFKREGVREVIYGLPVASDGGCGEQALKTIRFIEGLSRLTDVKLIPHNERFTSHAAQKSMRDIGMGKKRKRKLEDRLAAVIILQGYLDSLP
jgi:putative Holliday junction resolvase